MKYSNWLKLWLDNYVKPSNKKRTYQRYRQIAQKHIEANLGEFQLDELSPLVLQRFVTQLSACGNSKSGEGLAANSVNMIISVVQNSLKTAHMLGYAKEYCANAIKRPKIAERKVECFSVAEQKKIEKAVQNCKKQKMKGVLLCLYTGLRIGELLALRWQDVDLQKGLICVERTSYDMDGKIVFDKPKTPTSRRIIPVPKQLLPIIKNMKKNSRSEFVVSQDGNPVGVRSYQRSFELLLKKLGIEHRGFHALRHTFATRALECGMDVRTLAEILGHKNPIVTLNRYAHSLSEHKSAMMNRLGKLL